MSQVQQAIVAIIKEADNNKRKQAEAFLEQQVKTNAESLIGELFDLMGGEDNDVAQFACVYIKKQYVNSDAGISREGFESIKDKLFLYVNFDKSAAFLQSLAFLIVKVFAKLEQFEKLLERTTEWGQHSDAKARSFSMYLIEVLADVHIPVNLFKQYISNFATLFQNGLGDDTINVKVSTLKATSAFLTSLQDKQDVKQFSPIIEPMINVMIEALQSDEMIGRKSLESLVQLSEYHPTLFENYCVQLVNVVSQIMENTDFDEETRSIATELVCSIAEQYPALLRKTAEVQTKFFPALFRMMTECELQGDDEQEEWATRVEQEELSKTDVHSSSKLALSRFAKSIGEKTTISATTEIIKNAITAEQWYVRHAGYYFLGYLNESCKTSFGDNLDEIMRMAASGCVDNHPRVRFAGLACLGLLLSEQAPKAQKKFHADIVPQLVEIMSNDALVKVKTQAVAATINFVRELIRVDENNIEETKTEKDVIEPYVPKLMEVTANLLQESISSTYSPLQEEVLALLAVIAQVISTEFSQYYNQFMPGLIQILQNTSNSTAKERDLKANTIQCIGFLMEAVKENKEQFEEDAKNVTDLFVQLLEPGVLTEDDPQMLSIVHALTQVSAVLGENFTVYLPKILQKLLKDAQGDVDFKLEDAEIEGLTNKTDTNAGLTSVTLNMKGLEGQKKLTLNTNALENKINAVQAIRELAKNLEQSFFGFVNEVWAVLKELFDYKYSKACREAVYETASYLVAACPDDATRAEVYRGIFPYFKKAIQTYAEKADFEELTDLLNGLLHCTNKFKTGGYISVEEVIAFTQELGKCAWLTEVEKQTRLKQFEEDKPTLDEEDYEDFEAEIDDIQKLGTNVMELSGEYMKHFKDPISDAVKANLIPPMAKILEKENQIPSEIIDSACFFIDILDHLSQDLFNELYQDILQKFFTIWDNHREKRDRSVLQSCGFGFGVIAQRAPHDTFAQYSKPVLERLVSLITDPEAQEDDNVYSYENCISSLGKLVYFHTDGNVVNRDTCGMFLSLLPLQEDNEEAQPTNNLFFEQVLAGNQALMVHKEHVMQAVQRIKEYHEQNPDLETIDEEGLAKLAQILG